MTASDRPAADRGDGDELREAMVDEIGHWPIGSGYYQTSVDIDEAREMVDAVLALPALADLLADRERVRRVRETVKSLDDIAKILESEVAWAEDGPLKANELGKAMGYRRSARDLRRALDGTT